MRRLATLYSVDYKQLINTHTAWEYYLFLRDHLSYNCCHYTNQGPQLPLRDILFRGKQISQLFFVATCNVLKWRHNHSHSPVSSCTNLYSTGGEISRFWYVKPRERKKKKEKEKSISIFFIFLSLSGHSVDCIKKEKKTLRYTLKTFLTYIAFLYKNGKHSPIFHWVLLLHRDQMIVQ